MHSKEFIERMKDLLLEEKEKLTDELANLKPHTELENDDNSESDIEAQEFQTDEVNRDLIADLEGDLQKVDAALERIEKGVYGASVVSGADISESRLEVIPWAETTEDEESTLENEK